MRKTVFGAALLAVALAGCTGIDRDAIPTASDLMVDAGDRGDAYVDTKLLAIATAGCVYAAHRPEVDRSFSLTAQALCVDASASVGNPFGDGAATVMRRTAIWVSYRNISQMLEGRGERLIVRVAALAAGGLPSPEDIRRIAEKGALIAAVIADVRERMDMVRSGVLNYEQAQSEFRAEIDRAVMLLGERAGSVVDRAS